MHEVNPSDMMDIFCKKNWCLVIFASTNVCLFYILNSMIFSMQNWSQSPLISKLKDLAARRKLEDLTVGPVLTVSSICVISIFCNY